MDFLLKRQLVLDSSITENYSLLKGLEDKIRVEDSPLVRAKYENQAKAINEKITSELFEYDNITNQLRSTALGLALELKDYLSLMNWKADDRLYPVDGEVEFVVEKPEGLFIRRALVRFTADDADFSSLERLNRSMDAKNIPFGWLIAENRVDPAVREFVSSDPKLTVSSFDELLSDLVSMDNYVEWLDNEYLSKEIDKYYIDLSYVKIDLRDSVQGTGSSPHSLNDDYVSRWLYGRGQNHLLILGGVGTGKTWFSLHFAKNQMERFFRNPINERIPLVLSLRDYSRAASIDQLLVAFRDRHQTNLANPDVFENLNRKGKLLIIFDGFDEIAQNVEDKTLVKIFWELASVAVPRSKVILTSRPRYFETNLDENRIPLESIKRGEDLKEAPLNRILIRPNFVPIRIEPMSEGQIVTFLMKRLPAGWKKLQDLIATTFDLPNLAQSPILLQMIIETIPLIQPLSAINSFVLYRIYTDNWIQKSVDAKVASTDISSIKRFIYELAWRMYHGDSFQPNQMALPDIDVQSFLVRNKDGEYFFAHKSFMEYFVSVKMFDLVRSDDISGLSTKRLSDEVLNFLAQTDIENDEQLLDKLVDWANTGNEHCRWNITALFVRFKNPQLISVILNDPTRIWNNAEIIWSLGERSIYHPSMYDERVVEFLKTRIKDSSTEKPWWNSAFALKSITKIDPLSVLIENLNDPSWSVDYALNHFEDRRAIVAILKAVRNNVLGASAASSAIVELWPQLRSNKESIYNVCWTFGALRSPLGIPILEEAAQNDDFTLRNRAAEALGQIGGDEVIPLLLELLQNDAHYRVRRYAAESLGKIGNPKVMPELRIALENEWSSTVRNMIEKTITQLEQG